MELEINGTVVATLTGNDAPGPYWSYAFGPGTYTLTFLVTGPSSSKNNFNIYGLWASN